MVTTAIGGVPYLAITFWTAARLLERRRDRPSMMDRIGALYRAVVFPVLITLGLKVSG